MGYTTKCPECGAKTRLNIVSEYIQEYTILPDGTMGHSIGQAQEIEETYREVHCGSKGADNQSPCGWHESIKDNATN